MRPLFTLPHVVGLIMLGYAVGVLTTPTAGVMNWIALNTFLHPPAVAALFAGCGVYILIASPAPALFSLLTVPLLLYGVASVLFYIGEPSRALTAVIAHNGLWLAVNAALFDIARRGSIPIREADIGPTH
jgi:hypothetical protein